MLFCCLIPPCMCHSWIFLFTRVVVREEISFKSFSVSTNPCVVFWGIWFDEHELYREYRSFSYNWLFSCGYNRRSAMWIIRLGNVLEVWATCLFHILKKILLLTFVKREQERRLGIVKEHLYMAFLLRLSMVSIQACVLRLSSSHSSWSWSCRFESFIIFYNKSRSFWRFFHEEYWGVDKKSVWFLHVCHDNHSRMIWLPVCIHMDLQDHSNHSHSYDHSFWIWSSQPTKEQFFLSSFISMNGWDVFEFLTSTRIQQSSETYQYTGYGFYYSLPFISDIGIGWSISEVMFWNLRTYRAHNIEDHHL